MQDAYGDAIEVLAVRPTRKAMLTINETDPDREACAALDAKGLRALAQLLLAAADHIDAKTN